MNVTFKSRTFITCLLLISCILMYECLKIVMQLFSQRGSFGTFIFNSCSSFLHYYAFTFIRLSCYRHYESESKRVSKRDKLDLPLKEDF